MSDPFEDVQNFIDQGVGEITKIRDEAQRAIEAKFNEVFAPTVQAIFDATGIKGFYVYGYVPAFNDGDPCVHRSYLGDIWSSGDVDFSDPDWIEECDLEGVRYADTTEEQDKEIALYCIDIRSKPDAVKQILNKFVSAMGPTFQEIYGDDWFLIIKSTPEGVVIENGDYEDEY